MPRSSSSTLVFLLFFLAELLHCESFFTPAHPRRGGRGTGLHLSDEFEEDLSLTDPTIQVEPSTGKECTWRAYKKSTVVVNEIHRSVEAYMALPSSE